MKEIVPKLSYGVPPRFHLRPRSGFLFEKNIEIDKGELAILLKFLHLRTANPMRIHTERILIHIPRKNITYYRAYVIVGEK